MERQELKAIIKESVREERRASLLIPDELGEMMPTNGDR